MSSRVRLVIAALSTLAGAAAAAPPANAATTVLGAQIPCAAQSDGVRFCQGSTVPPGAPAEKSFDGTIIDANVTLPPAPASGPDGGFPLIIVSHGYGGSKKDLTNPEDKWFPSADELARKGYAVLNATDRGFGDSCGSPSSRTANPQGCAQGWIKLMDSRWEVHDEQFMAGELADEGWIAPQRIGAIGESYGGGESLLLATLKDRVIDAQTNKAMPWVSPVKHIPLAIAAATPTIPWSDLISSLLPNGHTLTYTVPGPADDFTPGGDLKQSFVAGLYAGGQATGYYAPPATDSQADLTNWFGQVNTFPEPPESDPMFSQIVGAEKWKGALYFLNGVDLGAPDGEAPAPLLMSNGFTDDLFPVDETVRYYNLEKALFPSDPVALTYMDYGHMRGQNKASDIALLKGQIQAWLDHYVMGTGADPGQAVTALTQTCPASAASGGPFVADNFTDLAPGELAAAFTTAQTISSSAGDPSIAKAIDPVAGGGACATTASADQTGVATYRLPAATGAGYTLLGGPIVYAKMSSSGTEPLIAERLWDVAPDGSQSLVARGNYRPPTDLSQLQVFQLHPGAWHFAADHIPKLELLGQDPPYLRAPEGSFTVTISALGLILPTHETSGNGIVARGALPLPGGATPISGLPTESASTAATSLAGCSSKALHARSTARHRSKGGAKHRAKRHAKRRKKRATACTKPARKHGAKHHRSKAHHRATGRQRGARRPGRQRR